MLDLWTRILTFLLTHLRQPSAERGSATAEYVIWGAFLTGTAIVVARAWRPDILNAADDAMQPLK